MQYRHLKKGTYLVRQNEALNDVYFLISGATVGKFYSVGGKEFIDCICHVPGHAAASVAELELDVQSPIAIEVIMDSEFYVMPMAAVLRLKDRPEVQEIYVRLLCAAQEEHADLKRIRFGCSAAERIRWFREKYPEVCEWMPNKYIAEFLDISPETFSRLRVQ